MSVKLAVIYYSSTGGNYKLAQMAAKAAEAEGAEVKLAKVPELAPMEAIEQNSKWKEHYEATQDVPEATLDLLDWADAYIFSMPTRFGNLPAQIKQYLDTAGGLWAQGKLANKVVSAMSSASNAHGGQEATIQALYTSMMHWGAIIAAPGYTDDSIFAAGGNPYGTTVTIDADGNFKEDAEGAVKHQAKRTVTIAEWIQKGQR